MKNIVRGRDNLYLSICDIPANKLFAGNDDFPIYGVSDPMDPISNTVIFVKKKFANDSTVRNSIIVAKEMVEVDDSCIQIISDNPKNEYGKLLSIIDAHFSTEEVKNVNGSFIGTNVEIGKNTTVGKFCVIENDVIIGDNCEIADYVYIGSHTRIGNNVCIQERVSIGISDADIFREQGKCLTLKHLGGTIIKDGCLLLEGAHIAAGDTRATVISTGVMLGIHANLGHNSYVGRNTLIGAHACICGHCDIGDDAYIAPSSTIMNRLHIGKNVKVGLGAVVLEDVKADSSVFGNPAMVYWNKNSK